MKIVQITGILSVLLIGLLSCKSKTEEYQLKVTNAHFEVTFPVSKNDVEESMDIAVDEEAGEEYKVFSYIADVSFSMNENYSYMVVYNFFEGLNTKDAISDMFAANRDVLVSEMGGDLKLEKDITTDGVMQKSFCIDQGDDVKAYVNYYFRQGFFYRLIIVTTDPDFPNKSGSKFFNSFKILNN